LNKDRLATLDTTKLRTSYVRAVDAGGTEQYRWSVWACLVGEVVLDGEPYVLDEGEFFQVRSDYLAELDAFIESIHPSSVPLPAWKPSDKDEGGYNERAAAASARLVLLDKKMVRATGRTTAVEVCDLLSADKQLVHVKRHLGSSDLSHLFSQGLVSADLLQMNVDFRKQAHVKVVSQANGRPGFDFLEGVSFAPSEFEVVYAIIACWDARTCAEALPFFSKVNLREVANNLCARGFRVALNQISA
jgi:uncharacterized protein (TIGR04141 family)